MRRQHLPILIATVAGLVLVLASVLACVQRPTAVIVQKISAMPTRTVTPQATVQAVVSSPSAVTTIPAPTLTPTPGQTGSHVDIPQVYKMVPTLTSTSTSAPTNVPSPTPTPTLPWPEALANPGRSKVGIHVQWNNSPEIMEFIRRMKPRAIKAVGDLGFLEEVKAVSPSTVTVARLLKGQIPMEGDPVAEARAFVAENLEQYKRHPAVDYWEGLNEPGIQGRMEWYAAFETERARLMAENGLRVAVGAFSTGVPEWDEFIQFLPAIRAAIKYNGILTLHEYDAPTMDRSVGAGLPGKPGYPDRGAHCLRYRWWYEEILKPQGLVIPLVISETGIDGQVGNHPGPKGRGWQDYTGYWADQGIGRDGIMTYLSQLTWYDNELQKDPYVIGCTIFTAGAMGADWASYDITQILRHIATYIIVPAAK